MGLTQEQIDQLLASSRVQGGYSTKFEEFLASDERGICVNEEWAELANKQANTLTQGFKSAKEKSKTDGADRVLVKAAGE